MKPKLKDAVAFLILACPILLLAGGPPDGEKSKAPSKPAWAWTLEERIAVRTDPEAASKRVREKGRRVEMPVAASSSRQRAPIGDAFDGSTHPELFLPYEVFEQLVSLTYLSHPRMAQSVREGFIPDVRRHGLPADFFDRLQVLTTVYVADFRAVRDALDSMAQQEGAARERAEQVLAFKHRDACRSRADALAAARREFGEKKFDRFLYEVMAVKMFTIGDRVIDPALLREAEEGRCR